jgi:hypothetical protein
VSAFAAKAKGAVAKRRDARRQSAMQNPGKYKDYLKSKEDLDWWKLYQASLP